MPFLDVQNMFSDAQVVALAAAIPSTNTIDQSPSGTTQGSGARNIGAGRPIDIMCQFTASLGAVSTLRCVVYGADDAAMTVNKTVIADSGISAAFPAGSSGLLRLAAKAHKPRRFLRAEYDVAGAGSQFTVTCGFTAEEQTTPETVL
jgi:hypothetical protein